MMPATGVADGIEQLIEAAAGHGRQSEPEHQAGDGQVPRIGRSERRVRRQPCRGISMTRSAKPCYPTASCGW